MTIVICDRCEEKYDGVAKDKCPKCNSKMRRPNWEKDKVWVSKNSYVASTLKFESNSEYIPVMANFYYDSEINEMKRNKLSFKTAEELKNMLSALNQILKKLNWKSKIEYLKDIEKEKTEEIESTKKIEELIKKYPATILDILSNFDPQLLNDDSNLSVTKELLLNLNQTIYKTEENVKLSFKNVVKKISKQDDVGMDELSKLLETNSLLEITSVTRILMSRLRSLEMFETMVTSENTYEVKGDHSVQSMLERNMWILNEEWWLVQANKPLKQFIGDEIEKEKGNLRPDFVCVTFNNKLVIVDIKRPSHEITKKDIDQIENYKIIAKEYKGGEYKGIDCYLVGKKIPSSARSIANERRNINLLTYSDLTEDVKKKYTEYLKALEDAKLKEKNNVK